jgi:hypothetical protein
VSTDILPLLIELANAGQVSAQSNRGLSSEAQVQQAIGGSAGQALTTKAELGSMVKYDAAFSTLTTRRFIRLPDISKGKLTISPMAFLDGDLSQEHPYLRVQLVIVTHSRETGIPPQCLIMRFETPETNGDPEGAGEHDYYHSQLCTELRIDRSTRTFKIPQCIAWSATSCPAWPVDASTPLQLLACVVLALYGKVDGTRWLRNVYGNQTADIIRDMHLRLPAPSEPVAGRRRRTKSKAAKPKRR